MRIALDFNNAGRAMTVLVGVVVGGAIGLVAKAATGGSVIEGALGGAMIAATSALTKRSMTKSGSTTMGTFLGACVGVGIEEAVDYLYDPVTATAINQGSFAAFGCSAAAGTLIPPALRWWYGAAAQPAARLD